jgi:hypothetical protein
MGSEVFTAVFDLTSAWFYVSLAVSIISAVVWVFAIREIEHGPDLLGKIILVAIYAIVFMLDKTVFLHVIRVQPCLDFGLYGTIIVPTILFYVLLLILLIFVVRTIRAPSLNVSALRRAVPGLFCLAGMQIAWAFGSASPTGVLLAVFNFVMTRIESEFVPDEPPPPPPPKVKTE